MRASRSVWQSDKVELGSQSLVVVVGPDTTSAPQIADIQGSTLESRLGTFHLLTRREQDSVDLLELEGQGRSKAPDLSESTLQDYRDLLLQAPL